jgi:protoporphyrinogen IX oxidase
MTAFEQIIPHVKALHMGFVALWMAGLLALPAMLSRHDAAIRQADFERIRQATHYGYIWAVTPLAALAVGTGLALIFLREVFALWMFGKLVLVAALVTLHAWIGHTIVAIAETGGRREPPDALVPNLALCALVAGVLFLVLAKPRLVELPMPAWLTQPVGGNLPFDVPNP